MPAARSRRARPRSRAGRAAAPAARLRAPSLEEHERRPELDAERAAERLAAAVFDLDVAHARMLGERARRSAAAWRGNSRTTTCRTRARSLRRARRSRRASGRLRKFGSRLPSCREEERVRSHAQQSTRRCDCKQCRRSFERERPPMQGRDEPAGCRRRDEGREARAGAASACLAIGPGGARRRLRPRAPAPALVARAAHRAPALGHVRPRGAFRFDVGERRAVARACGAVARHPHRQRALGRFEPTLCGACLGNRSVFVAQRRATPAGDRVDGAARRRGRSRAAQRRPAQLAPHPS